MRTPVNEQDQVVDAQYTNRELWLHYAQLSTRPEFSTLTAATEILNITRQHFNLLTQGRLPAVLREYLGTDAIYDENGRIRCDVWRMGGISQIMLAGYIMEIASRGHN